MPKKTLRNLIILFVANIFFINSSYACTVFNTTQDPGKAIDLTTITNALSSASAIVADPFDVIEFSGTCVESVVITFPITLQGNGGILRAPAPSTRTNAIEIYSDGVTIQGASGRNSLRIKASRYGILVANNGAALIQTLKVQQAFAAGMHIRDGADVIINNVTVENSNPPASPPVDDITKGNFGDEGAGIVVTRNGGAAILNSLIRNNADSGIDVFAHGIAEIDNVVVTGNDFGILVEGGSSIELKNSDINNNTFWGIELFATSANIIGDEDGSPGDVLVQNNGGGGISIIDSKTEIYNTTVSGNGGNAVFVFGSSIGLFGGNSISADGASDIVCAWSQFGPGFTAGGFDGSSDSITVVNDDGDDTALCVNNSSEFHHSNITITGTTAISASGHSEINLSEHVSGTTSVTGDVNTNAYALLTLGENTTLTGDITASNATGTLTSGTITGNVILNDDAKLFHFSPGTISGSLSCSGLIAQAYNFGGTIGSLSSDTTEHLSCTGVF